MFGSFVFTHLDFWGVQQLLPFRHSQICLLKCTVPNDVPQWRASIVQCNPVRFALIFHAQTQSSKRCRPKGTGFGFRVMKTCSATFIVSSSVIPIFRIVRERLLQRRKEQWSKLNWQQTNVTLVCLFICLFVCLFVCSNNVWACLPFGTGVRAGEVRGAATPQLRTSCDFRAKETTLEGEHCKIMLLAGKTRKQSFYLVIVCFYLVTDLILLGLILLIEYDWLII